MTEISIIIPVYNAEKYLPRCLNSVLAQTFTDFEAVCVNDGSKDNSAAILDDYAKKDPRIKVITQPNQGISVARNIGIKKATGNEIYFLDSDDCIHPQTLEIAHRFMTEQKADVVSFDFAKNDTTTPIFKPVNISDIAFEITNKPLYFKNKIYPMHINVWTKLYKRQILQDLEFIPHIHFEDYPFTLVLWQKNPKTVIIKEKLYFYTLNENSVSHSKAFPQQIKDYDTGLRFIYEAYKKPEFSADFKYLCRTYIPNIIKQQLGRCQRADKEVRQAMFQNFAIELRHLRANGMLTLPGHKLTRYLKYLWIMRKYKNV